MADPIEIVFYVHGVSPHLSGRNHTPEYEAMHRGIARHSEEWPADFSGAEWGWNVLQSRPGKSQEMLTDAQRMLGGRVLPAVDAAWDFTLNPGRHAVNSFRKLFFYNFADMFYYVSADGKEAVRVVVATQIIEHIRQCRGDRQESPVSLTLLGHSAGSIVAFDFLFALFFPEGHEFVESGDTAAERVKDNMQSLRDMARQGMLRVRRLITFGSPISPLVFRSDPLVELLAADSFLDPEDYGLTLNPPAFSALEGPRWINIWDKDDPIAWPVEPLFEGTVTDTVVKDVYVDVSDLASKAHDRYWRDEEVHETIADRW